MKRCATRSGLIVKAQNDLVFSFLAVLGLFLPLSLLTTAILTDEPMHPSISEFYYGHACEPFVDSLCAIGVFLWSDVGYPRRLQQKSQPINRCPGVPR